ncbi:MAG: serine hydrolase, partial [Microbacterium sp.]
MRDVLRPPAGLAWSALVSSVTDDAVLWEFDADRTLFSASLGKVLLLIEVADRIRSGALRQDEVLSRTAEDAVADSGIWQFLRTDGLPVADLAALVGAVSDNLATNVLLRCVGIDAVARRAELLGLAQTRLLDRVRDRRGPGDPVAVSQGTAREYARLMTMLSRGEPFGPGVADLVLHWLSLGADLSMVAGAFGCDPL